jgi:hypothetical protein
MWCVCVDTGGWRIEATDRPLPGDGSTCTFEVRGDGVAIRWWAPAATDHDALAAALDTQRYTLEWIISRLCEPTTELTELLSATQDVATAIS